MKVGNSEGFITNLGKDEFNKYQWEKIANNELNENGESPGRFGWCYICRKGAIFYCKEERIPICSYECKLKNMDNLEQFNKFL